MSKSSGSQLYIKIISILNLIGGAFYILIGIIGFFGKGFVSNEELIEKAGGDTSAPAAVNVFLIIRAANDPSKIGPVFTLAVVSLGISVINLFVGIFGGNFSIHSLIECIPPALMTWCASNVKKQSNL